ncbi:MAG: sodium:proton antiporter [Magnetococcales bacterium]|nr:sodium:proton antiporter [Magnetococcales bacterium]
MLIPSLAVLLFSAVFFLMFVGKYDRRMVVVAGGTLFVLLGIVLDFYTLEMVWQSIYFETLALIFSLTLISSTLAKSGYFQVLAERVALYSRGDGWLILVLFSLITYFFSLFVNNLATMVVILPVTLNLCMRAEINPVPVVIAQIVASNLGGASTMIGDFPNMIISAAGGLHFFDFIGGMMVPTLILLAVTLLFFQSKRREIFAKSGVDKDGGGRTIDGFSGSGLLAEIRVNRKLLRIGTVSLFLTLGGFFLAELIEFSPAFIALIAGLLLLTVAGFQPKELFVVTGGGDILFFIGLFVMVGGLQAAGVLDSVSWLINRVSGGKPLFELLALLWIAGLATPFMNAGPATAFFIPVADELSGFIPGDAVWWALSLGVLAGSSASLTGATAGSIAASQMDEHIKQNPEVLRNIPQKRRLDFREYNRWGRPIMGLFLGISSLYIILISP